MAENTTAPERWRDRMKDAEIREGLDSLFSVQHEGARWLFATDGKVLVAECSDRQGATWESRHRIEHALRTVLTPGALHLGEIAVADLLTWTGAPAFPARNGCDACGGKGWVPHECDCSLCDHDQVDCFFCDGRSVDLHPAARPGRLFGHLLDRNRVAQVLSVIDAERVDVRAKQAGDYSTVHFDAPPQRVIVMGMHSFDRVEAPEFAGEGAVA